MECKRGYRDKTTRSSKDSFPLVLTDFWYRFSGVVDSFDEFIIVGTSGPGSVEEKPAC